MRRLLLIFCLCSSLADAQELKDTNEVIKQCREAIEKGDVNSILFSASNLVGIELPDLGYAGASVRKLFQSDRSKASDPKRLLTQLPELIRTATQLATFKAGDKRKTIHQHLFLPKDYSGFPTTSIHTPWFKKAAEAYLTAGWG